MYSYGSPHMAEQKQDDQLEHTFSSYVRIRDVALKTCWRWWTIGRSGERGSRKSVLAARHDDDDDDAFICLAIKSYMSLQQCTTCQFTNCHITNHSDELSHLELLQSRIYTCRKIVGTKILQNIWLTPVFILTRVIFISVLKQFIFFSTLSSRISARLLFYRASPCEAKKSHIFYRKSLSSKILNHLM